MHSDPEKIRRKQQIQLVASLVVFLLLIVALAFSIAHKPAKKTVTAAPTKSTTTYDANSGETVRTIPGEHGNTGVSTNNPIYLGVDDLLSAGITQDQLTNMETGFYRYTTSNSLGIKQISITKGSVVNQILNKDTNNEITEDNFTVVFDSKTTVKATLQYSGFEQVELFLYNSAGQQIFDSGSIDATSQSGD